MQVSISLKSIKQTYHRPIGVDLVRRVDKSEKNFFVGAENVVSELEDLIRGSSQGLLNLDDTILLTLYATLALCKASSTPYGVSSVSVYTQDQLQRLKSALYNALDKVRKIDFIPLFRHMAEHLLLVRFWEGQIPKSNLYFATGLLLNA